MALSGRVFYSSQFRHNVDEKNRLTVPAAWRNGTAEADQYLATPHPDGYIAVLPPAELDKLHEKVAARALTDREAQDAFARFFAASLTFNFDKQGRLALTPELLQHAGITKEVVLVGLGNKFALYSPEGWAKVFQRTAGDTPGDLMRRIGI